MVDKKLNILCLGVYDSMDAVLAPCAKELESRGHRVSVVVYDSHDEINTKSYRRAGLEIRDFEDFKTAELDDIDAVIAAPVKLPSYRRLLNGIDLRCIPTFSFATLYSSVLMKMRADIVFTIGSDKFREFEEDYLSYRCIAIGNPQYDSLVPYRKTTNDTVDIKNVLVVDQGLYPYGEKGKTQLAETLMRIAKSNPDMEFRIKPRYLKSERGVKTHRGSEYLSDYITEWPANLSEYEEPVSLEDVAPEYDALITTWSTAFMEALVLNMPMILIKGLDSLDIYDVRTQRVNDAYDDLSRTGCLWDWRELSGDISDKFRRADTSYSEGKIYHTDETCADKAADVIEWYCSNISSKDLMLDKTLQITYDRFMEEPLVFGTVPLDRETQGFKYIAERRRNLFLQDCVYKNRCLGKALDLSPLRENDPDLSQFHNWDELRPEVEKWEEQFEGILKEYYEKPITRELINKDIVLQDYYFEWLYNTGQYEEIESFDGVMLAECSWDYYMACVYDNRGHSKRAFEYLTRYLDAVENLNIVQIERQRRIQRMTRPFIEEGVNKYRWYTYIYRNNKGKLLDSFGQKGIRGVAFYDLVRIRTANADGDYEKAVDLYELYNDQYQKQLKKQKKSLKSRLRAHKNRIMHGRIEKEYSKAKKELKNG